MAIFDEDSGIIYKRGVLFTHLTHAIANLEKLRKANYRAYIYMLNKIGL